MSKRGTRQLIVTDVPITHGRVPWVALSQTLTWIDRGIGFRQSPAIAASFLDEGRPWNLSGPWVQTTAMDALNKR